MGETEKDRKKSQFETLQSRQSDYTTTSLISRKVSLPNVLKHKPRLSKMRQTNYD